MKIIFNIIAYLFSLLVRILFYIIESLFGLLAPQGRLIKEDLKNKSTRGELAGAILALIVLAVSLHHSYTKASEEVAFNLTPPTESSWTIGVLKGDFNDYQQHWMTYAWNKWHDKEFMYMMASENGLFNHDRQSLVPNEPSYGFCQIHKGYHPEIVNDPRFFSDPAWQLEQCNKLFTGGTIFYGYERFKKGGEFARARKALFNF